MGGVAGPKKTYIDQPICDVLFGTHVSRATNYCMHHAPHKLCTISKAGTDISTQDTKLLTVQLKLQLLQY